MDVQRMYLYKYKFDLVYLDNVNHTTKQIKTESIKSIIIDHNYEKNCMPIIYIILYLDKRLVDHMILHNDENLFALTRYKYNTLDGNQLEIESFRRKFTYITAAKINQNDTIDYTEKSEEQMLGDTYRSITFGLLCVDHINNNKRTLELNARNVSMFDSVRNCTSHMDNIIIEPFTYNDTFDHLIMPIQSSVKQALNFLNNYRVFYSTPYRYYQDFNYTYIVSSNAKSSAFKGEDYKNIIITIKELIDSGALDPGMTSNKDRDIYFVVVNHTDTAVYDNNIANKSKTKIRGITSSYSDTKSLLNTASYSTEKTIGIRLNNDNKNMLSNIVSDTNSSNFFINITKNDLDCDIFNINKRFTIHHIPHYQYADGEYLLTAKKEIYIREDTSFVSTTTMTLKKFET